MKKTNEHPKNFIYFDTSKIYVCPMVRENTEYPDEITDMVNVRLVEDKYGYFIEALTSGYKRKYFYDKYLQWLFKTKYIRET